MMKLILYHDNHFENWDYRNVDIGIGGSETHQIEMAWRLAQRGYEIISYAPIKEDTVRLWRGTHWRHIDEVDWTEEGLWVIYRRPERVDNLNGQRAWLLCQDVDYPTLNEERAEKFEYVIALTQEHAEILVTRKPYLRDKILISSNGIRMDVIREVEKEPIERNHKRVMFASSPDRGLLETLQTFNKARKYDPELEIHTFYGFNNINKIINQDIDTPTIIKNRKYREACMREADNEGIFTHGRVPQRELYQEWLKTGIWLYQTNFFETSCQLAGSLIFTKNGMKPIEDIKVGDLVLTHKGRFRKVTKLIEKDYKGNVFKIKRQKDFNPIVLTEEHPIFTASYHRRNDAMGATRIYNKERYFRTEWKTPSQIIPKLHSLITPRMSFGNLDKLYLSDYIDFPVENGYLSQNHNNSLYKKIKNEVMLTEEFMYLLGLFAAEGCVSNAKSRHSKKEFYSAITTAHHKKEEGLAEKFANYFNGKVKQISENEVRTVSYSSVWANFLKIVIGTGKDKHFPDFIWDTNKEMQESFMQGYLDGDGYIDKHGYTILSTISPSLAYGLAQIMANLGHFPSIHYYTPRDCYIISLANLKNNFHVVKEDYITSKAEHITSESYEGKVYNFEVEEDESYVNDRTIVHNCITCMEAQALGAIPITKPYGALFNNVMHGVFIQGDAFSAINRARYMAELLNLAKSKEYQDEIRPKMMYDARLRFNWERVVDQWDSILQGWDSIIGTQYNFQFKHAKGKILNLGCHVDNTGFKRKLGAINLDRFVKCPYTEMDINPDVIADARDPLPFTDKFDSIIIGDLLEHLTTEDSIKVLSNAKAILNRNGKIIITCPDDQRTAGESITDAYGKHKPMPKKALEGIIRQANLQIVYHQPIDYTFAEGNGIICQ